MRAVDEDGIPHRTWLEASAKNGNKEASAELVERECPECMEYLVRWARQLHGRSGVSMSGLLPLSYTTIADWARLTDTDVDPLEVDALMQLDAAMLYPEEPKEDGEPEVKPTPAWPTKKANV